MSFGIRLHVSGARACFTRPELKVERVSYDVMTPSAARGILEAIHWKPAIRWVVDRILVLRPIRFQTLRRNEVGAKAKTPSRMQMAEGRLDGLGLRAEHDRQQRAAMILTDVAYVIEAHFTMTAKAGAEDNEGKHLDIFNRRAARGQCFHQPCLGMREFPAAFELIPPGAAAPGPAERSPDLGFGAPRDLGLMLWDIDHQRGGSMFFRARLEEGAMDVPAPGSAAVLR